MSTEDFNMIVNILNGLQHNDNIIRREAEKQLEVMQEKNITGLLFLLSTVLTNSNQKNIRTYAAVLIRKFLDLKGKSGKENVWATMNKDFKIQIKTNTLKAIINEKERSVKFNFCDTIAKIAENIYDAEDDDDNEEFNDLISYLFSVFTQTSINDNNSLEIEAALVTLSKVFGFIYDKLKEKIDILVNAFRMYFKSNNMNLRTKCTEAMTEIFCIVKKKDAKKFKEFMFYILETSLKCMENPKEETNLKSCLNAIADLCETTPNVVRKLFADIFILMGKIHEKTDFCDESIRVLGFEILVSIVEKKKDLLSKDLPKTKILIEQNFKYALEIEQEITNEWLFPKAESYLEEEIIEEEKVRTSMSFLERLINIAESKNILPFISECILTLLKNNGGWKYKYIALMAISQISENIEDLTQVEPILDTIYALTEDENPKIRYAGLQCISELSEYQTPHYQNTYYGKVFDVLLKRLSDPVLRNQLQACDTLQTFLEGCSEDTAAKYAQKLLDVLMSVFLNESSPISLREIILNVLNELVQTLEKSFTPYAEKCLEILINFFALHYNNKTSRSLYGNLLENITTIGPFAENTYHKYLKEIIPIMINIQDELVKGADPIRNNLNNAWERICKIIKNNFPELIAGIVESILKQLQKLPEMHIASLPKETFKIGDVLGSLNPSEEKVKHITTSDTEEITSLIELLSVYISTFKGAYLPYIEATEKIVLPLVKYEHNAEVREETSSLIPELITAYIDSKDRSELTISAAKNYISVLIEALFKEDVNLNISVYLENLGNLIENVGKFLSTPELNILFLEILKIFDKVEQSRLDLHKRRDQLDDEYEKGSHEKINDSDDEENSDDVFCEEIEKDIEEIEDILVAIVDIFGTLFKTHKELTLEMTSKLITELLPKYLKESASFFETKMGIFIVDDMIEYLGQDLLEKIWGELAKTIFQFSDHNEPVIRQAAVFGLGNLAIHTKRNFSDFQELALAACFRALSMTNDGDDEDEWAHAKENAISALGKIIKYQSNCIDLQKMVNKWILYLPLQNDEGESHLTHDFLCELMLNETNLVCGENKVNLPKIIRILVKIHSTKFSTEVINGKIDKIIELLKGNSELMAYVHKARDEAEDGIRKKIDRYFTK